MNPLVQNFLLSSVVPAILFLLLMALVAILGVTRWRPTLLALALAALAPRLLGVAILHQALSREPFFFSAVFLQAIGNLMVNLSISTTTVGVFLALVLAARAHSWGWFSVILLAAILSTLTANFAFSMYGLLVFDPAHARQTYLEPGYFIFSNIIAGLDILVILLFALLGPQTTAAVAPDAG